jgi:hypothetical protein
VIKYSETLINEIRTCCGMKPACLNAALSGDSRLPELLEPRLEEYHTPEEIVRLFTSNQQHKILERATNLIRRKECARVARLERVKVAGQTGKPIVAKKSA